MLHQLTDLLLHLDLHLNGFAAAHQTGVYLFLCLIIFCETALVVTPFLSGDSLLFAVGALAAAASPISLPLAILLLFLAASTGTGEQACRLAEFGKNCGYVVSWARGSR